MNVTEVWDHALDVEVIDDDEVTGFVVHPPTCFCVHHWDPEPGAGGLLAYAPHCSRERRSCVIEHEDTNIGLFDHSWCDGSWTSLCVEEEELREAAQASTARDVFMPIYVHVEYGWSASTPIAPSEYDWYFSWRPQTAEEMATHAEELAWVPNPKVLPRRVIWVGMTP